jgi:site-specific recombinase XerC
LFPARHAALPRQKEAIFPKNLIAMLETLTRGSLHGLRDRAMMQLLGFAGGLRRSEITGRDQTDDGRGWVETFDNGALVSLRGTTDWLEVEIGRGSSDATCPIAALERIDKFALLARRKHSPPACVAIFPRQSAASFLPAICCAPALPPRPAHNS